MDGKSGSLLWKWDAEVLFDSQCGCTESYRNYGSRQKKVDRVSVQRNLDSIVLVVEKKSRQIDQ